MAVRGGGQGEMKGEEGGMCYVRNDAFELLL